MKNVLQQDKGLALVVSLLVVALLAITVVDFTFSATIDRHMARNSLHALQASLLARSGVNIGEGFLLQDEDEQADAFSEEWCPEMRGNTCRIDAALLGLPAGMSVDVRILDERGKLNVNSARPVSWAECSRFDDPEENNPLRSRFDSLGRLLASRGVSADAVEAYETYWRNVCESLGAVSSAQATPGAFAASRERKQRAGEELRAHEFTSLDALTGIPGFTPATVRRLRHVLTAQPARSGKINANTAPRDVLAALFDDEGLVEDLIARREEAPLGPGDVSAFRTSLPPELRSNFSQLLSYRSNLYRVCAVATVNSNPVTGTGGVRRSASMLVLRLAGFTRDAPAGGRRRPPLTRMEWQKEGGASLCLDDETDSSDGDFLALESLRTDR
jgi:type II secretory pathway component PulK